MNEINATRKLDRVGKPAHPKARPASIRERFTPSSANDVLQGGAAMAQLRNYAMRNGVGQPRVETWGSETPMTSLLQAGRPAVLTPLELSLQAMPPAMTNRPLPPRG